MVPRRKRLDGQDVHAIYAEVNKGWAAGIRDFVEAVNFPGQRLKNKITFSNLGGLAIWFWDGDQIFANKEEREELVANREAINLLTANIHTLVTTTSRIINAANRKNGAFEPLQRQLSRRMDPPYPLGYDPIDVQFQTILKHRKDEIWLFPAHKLVEIERVDIPWDAVMK